MPARQPYTVYGSIYQPSTPTNSQPQSTVGGVLNVDIDGNNALQIKAIGVVISAFETSPNQCIRYTHASVYHASVYHVPPTGGCLAFGSRQVLTLRQRSFLKIGSSPVFPLVPFARSGSIDRLRGCVPLYEFEVLIE